MAPWDSKKTIQEVHLETIIHCALLDQLVSMVLWSLYDRWILPPSVSKDCPD